MSYEPRDDLYDRKTDWSLIPAYMIGGLRRYIEYGIEPGDFLSALLSNDLRETFIRADDTNAYIVRDYVKFLYCYAPSECWGRGRPDFIRWCESGGLVGQMAKREADALVASGQAQGDTSIRPEDLE